MKKLFCYCVLAIVTNASAQQLSVTNYSPKEGAPPLGGTYIFQDSNGWIWFTDGENVIKYDGIQFKIIPVSSSCRTEFVYRVFEVKNEIWAMATPQPVKVVGDSLYPLDVLPKKLNLVNQINFRNKIYFLGENGLYVLQDEKLLPFIIDTALKLRAEAASILPGNDSLLLTYDYRKNLLIFDVINKSLSRIAVDIVDLRKDPSGNIHILSGETILKLTNIFPAGNSYQCEFTEIPVMIPMLNPKMFLIDRSGNIWIMDQYHKLLRRNRIGIWFSYTEDDDLPGLWFNHMMLDRENNLWVVFNGAICKVNSMLWDRFTVKEGLYSNIVTTIQRDDKNIFIVTASGTNLYRGNQIIRLLDKKGNAFKCTDLVSTGDTIYFIRDHYLVFAVLNSRYEIEETTLLKLPDKPVQLIPDKKGNLFIATHGGLYTWNKKDLRFTGEKKFIYRLMLDKQNNLWTGEFGAGLHRYTLNYAEGDLRIEKKEYIEQIGPEIPLLKQIRSLSEDVNGNIFVGTRYNGLFILSMRKNSAILLDHFDKQKGLKSYVIWSLTSDMLGNTWVATGNGLQSIRKENDQWKLQDENERRQIYHINYVLADSNYLWLSSQPGAIRFNIGGVDNSEPFQVELLTIRSGNKTVSPAIKKFPFHSNSLNFEFSANSFLDEKNILYSYRMLGTSDTNWSKPVRSHNVYYSSLLPGNYQFQVRAINVNGKPSSNFAQYSFIILKPFWQTAWFIGLSIIAVLIFLYFIYRYRLQQVMKLHQMRNTISRDLHDDIGASLSNINILTELAKRNAGDKEKAIDYLQKAGEDIQHISESLSDIVWNINPKYDDI
jgi:ligand-binding sensor domain-containing protein